ncbi:MAG: MsnO8 family LLM class oxidoreductase [Cellvibrionaceae bacterium]
MLLSILDQSPIRQGGTAHQALQETLELARLAEALGYHRFWVSEHHSTDALAGTSPEVLLAAIGQATEHIRIGSGGIMLPHYSPFKVAELASTLATLFPDRVDIGLGRAPGTDMISARALSIDGKPRFEQFPQQVADLKDMLFDPQYRPQVNPKPPTTPDLWMLGSSPDSAILAGQQGLPYNFALFINPHMDKRILDYYREQYQANDQNPKPKTQNQPNDKCSLRGNRSRGSRPCP